MAKSKALGNVFKLHDVINVKDPAYGAKGDGVAIDRTAIQAALDAVPSAGGKVHLPPGTYLIDDDLLIRKSNVQLCGSGAGVTTIQISASWTGAPTLNTTVAAMLNLIHSGNVDGSEGVTINNIEISGIRFLAVRPTADPTTCPKGISSVYAHNVSIHHCRFEEFESEVIWPAGVGIAPSTGWKISENHFTACGVLANSTDQSCIQMNLDDSIANNNVLDDVGSGISLTGRRCSAVGNIVRTFDKWGIAVGDAVNQGIDAAVVGNSISTTANTAQVTHGILVRSEAKNVVVSGNDVLITSVAGMTDPKGIKIEGANGGVRVVGNVVTMDMDNVAVTVSGIQGTLNGLKAEISDNTIRFVNTNNGVYHAGIGITASNGLTMTNVVSGNRVLGALSNGAAFDLNRSGTGVHILTALNNVTDGGYHRYDGVQYVTANINNVPLSFVSVTGASGIGIASTGLRTQGATSVADGGTVTHKLGATPTQVRATPTIASEFVSVTAVSATTFTVAIKKHDNAAGTTQTIYWEAEAAPS